MLKNEVLKILLSNKSHVSGQNISKYLGVSRTAIWKAVSTLKKDGYNIESVNNKGYLLLNKNETLSRVEIEQCINAYNYSNPPKIIYLNEVDSTNNYAKKVSDSLNTDVLVVSDMLTLGKGRLGRSWDSPSGSSIFMSLCIKPDIAIEKASIITLVMAVSLCEAIEEIYSIEPLIKWPNDIVFNSKKISGILTEMSSDMDGIKYIISGVGINVNNKDFPDNIKETASSLFLETGTLMDRARLIASTVYHFYNNFNIFLKTEDMTDLKEKYEKHLANIGKEVKILDPKNKYTAIALGIDESGALLVNTDGKIKRIISGEVSVRGLYGYV